MKTSKLTIYTDGASKGNPGPAGIGIVITTDNGSTVEEISEYIGEQTNNAAEYTALIKALTRAHELGATELNIYVDSELIERQLSGAYKVKSQNLRLLRDEVQRLMNRFSKVSITHVSRYHNAQADKLAKQAASVIQVKDETSPEAKTCSALKDEAGAQINLGI